jgi:hypothetical protein
MEFSIVIESKGKNYEYIFNKDTGLFCQYSPTIPLASFSNWDDLIKFILEDFKCNNFRVEQLS